MKTYGSVGMVPMRRRISARSAAISGGLGDRRLLYIYKFQRIKKETCLDGMSLFAVIFLCQKILRYSYLKEPDNHSKNLFVILEK